ncbi:GumC family protein [Lacipirellula sp.]|uniref:GumC family protein n=1 Tax=Lacipirellula sp. TaxID=2691419 RepID=UPI003D137CA2
MMNHSSDRTATNFFGPMELLRTFYRHKKKAIFCVASILALATLVLLYAPRTYRSEARLFLQVGRESVRLDPTATTGKTIALQQSGRDNEIATAIEVMKSRAIVEKAVDQLTPEVVLGWGGGGGDGKSEPNQVADTVMAPLHYVIGAIKSIDPISPREEAIIQIMRNLEVEAEFDSTVIVLTYDAETPQLAQQVMTSVVDAFRTEHVRLHRTSGSKPFFEEQRASLETSLKQSEEKLRDAKNKMGVASIDARRSTLEQHLSTIELRRNSAIQQIAAAEARIKSLQAHTDSMPERLHTSTRKMPNTGTDALRSQLYTVQVKLLDLESKYSADHPLVTSARAQMKEAEEMLKGEVAEREETVDSLNENHRTLTLDLAQAESQLAGLEAEMTELNSQREQAVGDLKQLNEFEVELDQLERDRTLAKTNFFLYAEALEQTRMDEALDAQSISNVNQAQAPTLSEKPVSPSKLMVGALSLMFAATGTTALVLGCEKLRTDKVQRQQGESPAAQVNGVRTERHEYVPANPR